MKHKLALIGCGGIKITRFKIRKNFDRIEVVATVDIELERAQASIGIMPNRPAFTTRDALPLCDAVLLALPHHLHCQYVLSIALAGKMLAETAWRSELNA